MTEAASRIFEISSTGVDEYLQLLGGDPFGGSSATGLRVPQLPTPDAKSRYLFNGCSFSVGEGGKARILGYRQLVTIGQGNVGEGEGAGPRFVEQQVVSPTWRFVDGNVWMGIRRLGGPNAQQLPLGTPSPTNFRSAAHLWADTPSLLYKEIVSPDAYYTNLSSYVPPNGGRPWGTPIEIGTDLLDLRTQWRTHGAWGSLGLEVEGPDTVSFFISVRQTNPATRTALSLPENPLGNGLGVEESFIQNFPNAIYWRVGVSLIVEFL
jgi:hypothetical protein